MPRLFYDKRYDSPFLQTYIFCRVSLNAIPQQQCRHSLMVANVSRNAVDVTLFGGRQNIEYPVDLTCIPIINSEMTTAPKAINRISL